MFSTRLKYEFANRTGTPAAPARLRMLAALALAAAALVACSDSKEAGAGDTAGGDLGLADGAGFGDTDSGSPPADAGDTGDLGADSDAAAEDTSTPLPCPGCFEPAKCIEGFCLLPEPGGCTPGATDGCVGDDRIRTCNADGTVYVPSLCPKNQGCIDRACRPLICISGEFICEGLSSKKECNPDGTGFLAAIPCAEGEFCQSGKCGSSCQIDPKFGSYVGCAFWTVDLPNFPDPFSNPTPEDLLTASWSRTRASCSPRSPSRRRRAEPVNADETLKLFFY
jgi:hypothetical protein